MRRLAPLVVGLWLAATAAAAATSDPHVLLDAPLLPEGSVWNAPTATVLDNAGDPLAVDLGRPVSFRALLLQADGNDVYWIESSEDGRQWTTVWRVPRAYGLSGLRTRTATLSTPGRGRYLRVRATAGDGLFSVARLRAYPEPPRAWPPALDERLASGPLPVWPLLTPASIATLQEAAAVLGVLAVAAALGRPRWRRGARGFLAVAALVSACGWFNFGNFRYHSVAHPWEIYHYYVGAKYFPELGYDHLYDCSVVAEAEDLPGTPLGQNRIRDLRTNAVVLAESTLQNPRECKDRFSAERWARFRDDVRFFRESLAGSWAASQTDHGFNATPVWTLVGRAIASRVPATAPGIGVLVAIDFVLILAALAAIFVAFGFEAGCLAVIFFGGNAFSRFAWTGGAFLRYDWFFWSVVGVCALRRERPLLGGFALMYAALLRIFPGVLLAGLALQALGAAGRGRGRSQLVALRPVILGGALALVTLLPATLLATGMQAFPAFVSNSRKYLATEADNRLGLATVLAYRTDRRAELTMDPLRPDPHADWSASQAQTLRERRSLLWLGQGLFLLLLAWATARHGLWVAAAAGVSLLPVLFRMANYYYALLTVGATLALASAPLGVGLALLAWSSHVATAFWPAYDERAVALSTLACLYAAMIPWALARRDGEPQERA